MGKLEILIRRTSFETMVLTKRRPFAILFPPSNQGCPIRLTVVFIIISSRLCYSASTHGLSLHVTVDPCNTVLSRNVCLPGSRAYRVLSLKRFLAIIQWLGRTGATTSPTTAKVESWGSAPGAFMSHLFNCSVMEGISQQFRFFFLFTAERATLQTKTMFSPGTFQVILSSRSLSSGEHFPTRWFSFLGVYTVQLGQRKVH